MVILSSLVSFIGILIEYVGIVIIIVAVVIALIHLPNRRFNQAKIRTELARNVLFGLEFIIAADILIVTVIVDAQQIMQLGGVVLVRIVLGYALKKEHLK